MNVIRWMRRRKAREPVTICSSPEAPLPTPFFTPQHPIASFRGHHEASQIGIRIFNAQPGYGVAFIRAAGLVHDYPRSASKFLLQEDVDRKVGLLWFGDSRRSNSMSSMSSRDTQFWYQDLVGLCRKQFLQSHWLTCHSLWGKHAEVCSGVIVEDDMIWYDMIWYKNRGSRDSKILLLRLCHAFRQWAPSWVRPLRCAIPFVWLISAVVICGTQVWSPRFWKPVVAWNGPGPSCGRPLYSTWKKPCKIERVLDLLAEARLRISTRT